VRERPIAIGFKMPEPLEAALARRDIRDATAALRQWADDGATMTAACVGTFVMAESGLLDGQHATTTWWLAPMFRKRYPNVQLDESNMIVKSGRFVTAGAALSHIDLALCLIREISPQLASLTAKYLIVDSCASQQRRSVQVSARSLVVCKASSANHRCRIFKACALSAPSIC
jgi:transcriptional regulator GlxA family with amidase domain